MPIIPLKIPKLGESVLEATIGKWLVKVGDQIVKNQVIAEIETDKISTEFISEYDGLVVRIYANENDTIEVLTKIIDLEVSDKDYEDFLKQNSKVENKEDIENSTISYKDKSNARNNSFLSPRVQKLALDNGLEINELLSITGTGYEGRIRAKDVENYIQKNASLSNEENSPRNFNQLELDKGDEIVELTGIQKKVGKNLLYSYLTIPQITTVVQADVSTMVETRNSLKKTYYSQNNLKLTYAHFCFYVTVLALKKFPEFNSYFINDKWVLKKAINLGFAVSLKNDDLLVPNIKNCQDLDFLTFISEVNSLIEKTKTGKLTIENFENTTFTCSNTGSFGSLLGTPLVSYPQVAVLAFGEIYNDFKLNENKEIIAIEKMHLSLSYDHRVINGALASKFLTEIKNNLLKLSFI